MTIKMTPNQINYLLNIIPNVFSTAIHQNRPTLVRSISHLSFEDTFKVKYNSYFTKKYNVYVLYNKETKVFHLADWSHNKTGFINLTEPMSPSDFLESLNIKSFMQKLSKQKFEKEILARLKKMEDLIIDEYVQSEMLKMNLHK